MMLPLQKKSNWLLIPLFILIATGISLGAFVAGFSLLSSWRNYTTSSSTQTKVEQPNSNIDINLSEINKPEEPEKPEELTQELEEANNLEEEIKIEETNPENESGIPEIVIDTITEPEPISPLELQPEINVPIITTGISKNKLVSTLGEPTTQRKERRGSGHTFIYQNVGSNQVHLSYHSDSTGKIRQTDIALSQSVSLGAMQDTLAEMLGGDSPSGVKEKLRRVYSRQTEFSFFKVGNLEGKVQRDGKDRIAISVWESGF